MKNGNYILIKAPIEYPGKKYRNKYVFEHHYVWWKNTGNIASKRCVIHHKNKNTFDDRFENLEEKEWAQHTLEHNKEHPAEIIMLTCAWCGVIFRRDARNVNFRKKNGQINFFCCRSHQVYYQHKK